MTGRRGIDGRDDDTCRRGGDRNAGEGEAGVDGVMGEEERWGMI
jgi:hypothetical protein